MNKISLLQRQQAFQRDAINTEHKLITVCKDHIKWLKGVPDIASTQQRIDVLYKCVEASKKKIAKLVEMQKFTKGDLQEAYNEDELSKWEKIGTWGLIDAYFSSQDYKHNPRFMGEAPAAEVGSVVGEEM